MGCFSSQVWWAVRAPVDGVWRGVMFGLGLAPKLGTLMNMLTSYIIPILFGGTCGAIGLALGVGACIGGLGEALAQLFLPQPYMMSISRILVDWVPGND